MKKHTITSLWGSAFNEKPDQKIQEFLSGRDTLALPPADEILIPYDIKASKAHATMLFKQKLIAKEEMQKLLDGLEEIKKLYYNGKFKIDPQKEDVHTCIESFLIDKYGIEIGGKIHTARSRNDQIVTATRLLLIDFTNQFIDQLTDLIKTIEKIANKYDKAVLPGYTHHQKAMPTTFKTVLLAYKEMFKRDKGKFLSFLTIWNKNPLGAAAGFGTSFPIDRSETAKLLNFKNVQDNTLDVVTSRGETEADFVYLVASLMNHFSQLAQTFIIYSTEEFGFIKLSEKYSTGSSIMPQKKNPDTLEVIKAKAGWVSGQLVSLLSITKSNMIGYNRDTQWTKYVILDVIRECLPTIPIVKGIIITMTINEDKMYKATKSGNVYATSYMEKLVQDKRLSLREAKIQVERMIKEGRYKEEEE